MEGLNALADSLNLFFKFGIALQDYYLTQSQYLFNELLLSLMIDNMLPIVLAIDNLCAWVPNIIIASSGSLCFDILAERYCFYHVDS
jgi:hypothetical protein